ncbi:hypothetical protein ACFXKR_08745 [Streptomyces violascens]|uniref:hypothetical protein n=1 Tax=Streptomyces violascens TaxID=67381 RepID=UPI0036B1AAF7
MTKSQAGHAARVCLPFASPGHYAGMRAEPFASRASKIWTCAVFIAYDHDAQACLAPVT